MFDRVYLQHWMSLPRDARLKLAEELGIPRNGITEVRDEIVLTDGHTNDDLGVITKELLQSYTGGDENDSFASLWDAAVSGKKAIVLEPTKEELIAQVAAMPEGSLQISHLEEVKEETKNVEEKKKSK